MVDDEVITYYFELNKRIAKVKGRLKKMRFDFYQQTMSSYCTSDEQKIYTKDMENDAYFKYCYEEHVELFGKEFMDSLLSNIK